LSYSIFALIVFIFQAIIAIVDFKIAKRYKSLCDYELAFVNLLCSISWVLTAGWWFFQALLSTYS